jgi:choline dehydrogenase-like flavoprotein
MTQQRYDVVIVGAGQAGSILAKVLSGAGRRVLILEAGLEAGTDLDAGAAYRNYVEGYLDAFYNASAKVPNSPYPNLPNAMSPNVLNLGAFDRSKPPVLDDDWPPSQDANLRLTSGYFIQKGQAPFGSDYQRAPGGTMLHWLGSTPRMLPNDFRMYTAYGQGVDWPITYEELKPYYEMAEREIGVSGSVAELDIPGTDAETYGDSYSFPMRKLPQSYLDNRLAANVKGKRVSLDGADYDLYLVPTPQGRNSTPDASYKYKNLEPRWDARAGRLVFQKSDQPYAPVGSTWDPYTGQRCEGNASCVPICPVQAKYNAQKTLKSALHNLEEHGGAGSITVIAQAVASRIDFDSEGRVRSIRYHRYFKPGEPDFEEGTAEGDLYVLAAHAVENAKLLLISDACPGNLNVGRHLMDHTTMLAWGLMPEWSGAYRGPGSTSNFPIFRDGAFRSRHAAWISPVDNWGWNWRRQRAQRCRRRTALRSPLARLPARPHPAASQPPLRVRATARLGQPRHRQPALPRPARHSAPRRHLRHDAVHRGRLLCRATSRRANLRRRGRAGLLLVQRERSEELVTRRGSPRGHALHGDEPEQLGR